MQGYYGRHTDVPVWLFLKWVDRQALQGTIGMRVPDGHVRWFWVLDGHIVFAWSTHPDESLLARLTARGIEITEPESGEGDLLDCWMQHLAQHPSVQEKDRWERAWTHYYVDLFRAVMRGLPDLEYAWVERTWTPYPHMVAAPLEEVMIRALDRPDLLQALRKDIAPAANRVLVMPAPSSDAEPMDAAETPIRTLLEQQPDLGVLWDHLMEQNPRHVTTLWRMIYRGRVRLQPIAQAAEVQAIHDLVRFYSHAFQAIGNYLRRELGDLADTLMEKNLAQIAAQHPEILGDLRWRSDFRIHHWIPALVQCMDAGVMTLDELRMILEELLLMQLLSVQQVLGHAHYATLVETVQTLRMIAPITPDTEPTRSFNTSD